MTRCDALLQPFCFRCFICWGVTPLLIRSGHTLLCMLKSIVDSFFTYIQRGQKQLLTHLYLSTLLWKAVLVCVLVTVSSADCLLCLTGSLCTWPTIQSICLSWLPIDQYLSNMASLDSSVHLPHAKGHLWQGLGPIDLAVWHFPVVVVYCFPKERFCIAVVF